MTDDAPQTNTLAGREVIARLAVFCAAVDRASVRELGAQLLHGESALLVCAQGVPHSGEDAMRILQQVQEQSRQQRPSELRSLAVRTDFALVFARDELRLCKFSERGGFAARGAFGANSVALVVADLTRRVGARTELQRACLTGLRAPRVLDAFAGWGMDAFALVGEGATVHCVEQQPALCALLCDAKRRVPSHMAERLQVTCDDALSALDRVSHGDYDVVYLDPMFPPRKKGALPNKRLQFLAELCEGSPPGLVDLVELIDLACSKAKHCVVLKRRKRDPLLAGRAPDRQVVGASVRYDIYAASD